MLEVGRGLRPQHVTWYPVLALLMYVQFDGCLSSGLIVAVSYAWRHGEYHLG